MDQQQQQWRNIRKRIVEMTIADLLGPAAGEDERISYKLKVRDRYLVGMLAPSSVQIAEDEAWADPGEHEQPNMSHPEEQEADSSPDPEPEEGSDSGLEQTPTFSPSSIGLSFSVSGLAEVSALQVTARWGQYRHEIIKYPAVAATDSEAAKQARSEDVWQRKQCAGTLELPLRPGAIEEQAPCAELPDVKVRGYISRDFKDDWVVSLYLFNGQALPQAQEDEDGKRKRRAKGEQPPDYYWLFQPELIVEATAADVAAGRVDIFTRRLKPPASSTEQPDERIARMNYRNAIEFAVGRNVGVHAECGENRDRARRLCTKVVPSYEVRRVQPRPIPELVINMRRLAGKDEGQATPDGAALAAMLAPLPTAYAEWLEAQAERVAGGEAGLADYEQAAQDALTFGNDALIRLREGIALLKSDPQAAAAFRFMNEAMWRQRVQSKIAAYRRSSGQPASAAEIAEIEGNASNYSWYTFQLAFILLNLPGITQLDHPDRSAKASATADLLWFPTGGGKTEAYLGLTAYTIAIRRLQGLVAGRRGDYGVAVLMRYTLRLLTVQQFQRAAALMCACEEIRLANQRQWGEVPIRLGLWVGMKTTPNTTVQAQAVVETAKGLSAPSGYGSPAQLTDCPWCGSSIKLAEQVVINKQQQRTYIYCSNEGDDEVDGCRFSPSESKEGLPVLVVDSEIYSQLPALLIATVDKFAMMPWLGATAVLFGQVERFCPQHGFQIGDMRCGKHTSGGPSPHGPLRPPDLIIQDELHLISGPLGTMVGLYETVVDQLASWSVKGQLVRPKLVASTATIKRANAQIKSLFLRQASVFPPSGLDEGDSFFAQTVTVDERPGRLYLGICALGKRFKVAQMRTYVALLAAAERLFVELGDEGGQVDSWMTLVGYFNSMRELGGMRRIAEDDIRARLRRTDQRGLANRNASRLQELTSRLTSDRIPQILRRLEAAFDPQQERERREKRQRNQAKRLAIRRRESENEDEATAAVDENEEVEAEPKSNYYPLDILLATSMISVGVDVSRLGLMVVTSQPKATAEYIQATSRVGRERPGLVCTVLSWARPRDLSHYEKFEHYHETFYQHVEPTSVTPFSARARDRGLAALMVALVRLRSGLYNRDDAAGSKGLAVEDVAFTEARSAISRRAAQVEEDENAGDLVELEFNGKRDEWLRQRDREAEEGNQLSYNSKKGDSQSASLLIHPGLERWKAFTALMSLREVEPESNLILDDTLLRVRKGQELRKPASSKAEETV